MRVGVVNEDDLAAFRLHLIAEVAKLDALDVSELANRDEAKELLADGKIDVLAFIGRAITSLVEELDTGDLFFNRKRQTVGRAARPRY